MAEPHRITAARCVQCGSIDVHPPVLCRRCGGSVFAPDDLPGRGRLVSWTVVRRPAGVFAHRDAFAVALVDLDAGLRLTGNLEGWEHDPPPLGAEVQLIDAIDGIPLFAARR